MNEVETIDYEQCAIGATKQVSNIQRVAGRHYRGQQLASLVVEYVRRYVTCTKSGRIHDVNKRSLMYIHVHAHA